MRGSDPRLEESAAGKATRQQELGSEARRRACEAAKCEARKGDTSARRVGSWLGRGFGRIGRQHASDPGRAATVHAR